MEQPNHTRIEGLVVENERGEREAAEVRWPVFLGRAPGSPEYSYKGITCRRDGDHLIFGTPECRLKIVSRSA